MDIVECATKDEGGALGGLEVSRTSLFAYGADLIPSYALFKGLLCRSSMFLWGEMPLEVLENRSGDLRLIWSNVQGEYELLIDSIRAKSPGLLSEGIRPTMLGSLDSGKCCLELVLATAG